MKVVFDSNVLLAALLTRGLCEALVALCVDSHEIVVSEAIVQEVEKHLRGKFAAPDERIAEFDRFIREHCRYVSPADVDPKMCRDPNDLAVLGTATASGADVLVTGDKDLLVLKRFEGIPILSPRELFEQLHRG